MVGDKLISPQGTGLAGGESVGKTPPIGGREQRTDESTVVVVSPTHFPYSPLPAIGFIVSEALQVWEALLPDPRPLPLGFPVQAVATMLPQFAPSLCSTSHFSYCARNITEVSHHSAVFSGTKVGTCILDGTKMSRTNTQTDNVMVVTSNEKGSRVRKIGNSRGRQLGDM